MSIKELNIERKHNIDSETPEAVNLERRGRPARPNLGQTPMLLRLLPYAILAAAVLCVPRYIFKPSPEGSNYYLTVLIYVGINTLLAVGLNLLMGYAGQVSLGHAAFYGIGAYVSAILSTTGMPQETIRPFAALIAAMAACAAVISLLKAESTRLMASLAGFIFIGILVMHFGPTHWLVYLVAAGCCAAIAVLFHMSPVRLALSYIIGGLAGFGTAAVLNHTLASGGISPWYAMIAGVSFACLIAYLMGVQALRLQGNYLAMATLGFGVIVAIVFLQWESVTGGTSGIYGIPNLQIAGKPLGNDISVYYLVWTLVTVVIALSANIVNSRVGRAFRAVHGSETAASTLGVDTARYKVQVFVLSAALASIAGSLYAHYVTFISPEPFGFKFSVELVVMVVVGGMASIWGAIFGAGTITVLGEVLRGLEHIKIGGLAVPTSDFDVVVFGVILIVIMIYLPTGLVRGVVDSAKFASKLARRKKEGK